MTYNFHHFLCCRFCYFPFLFIFTRILVKHNVVSDFYQIMWNRKPEKVNIVGIMRDYYDFVIVQINAQMIVIEWWALYE